MIWTQNGPYPQYVLATAYPPRQPPYEPQHQQSFEHHNKVCTGYPNETDIIKHILNELKSIKKNMTLVAFVCRSELKPKTI